MLDPMRRTSWTTFAVALACSLVLAPTVLAADGDLDPSFGDDGSVGMGRDSDLTRVALQPDGRIVSAGEALGSDDSLHVVRVTAAGELDSSFGEGGYVSLTGEGSLEIGAVEVQPDGRILVAATDAGEAADAVVFRLMPNGSPDDSFSGDGVARFDFAGSRSESRDIALQPDGRIVVTGIGSGFEDFVAARLTTDGGLDDSFSGDGRVQEDLGGQFENATAVVVQGTRIVVVGTTELPRSGTAPARFGAVALQANGSRETAWGPNGDGTVVGSGSYQRIAHDATGAPDGGLMIVGVGQPPGDDPAVFELLKLDATGRPDANFGNSGMQTVSFGGYSSAKSVTTTADGGYAVAGVTSTPVDLDWAVAKLDAGGRLDRDFGGGGVVSYPQAYEVGDIVRQPDGKLLVGASRSPLREMTVYRLQDSGSSGSGGDQSSLPFLEVIGGTATEGRPLVFTARLSRPTGRDVTFSYITGEGTAAGDRDYGARRGSATIPAGRTAVTIAIPTNSDRFFENDEIFRVELFSPSNARLGEWVAFGTIVNVLRSGRCQNIVVGRKGTDILTGSPGGDRIVGRQDIDFLYGLAGPDCIYGERAGDLIDGGSGNDLIDGGSGNDQMRGGAGHDRIYGRRGRNRYNGGDGNDRIYARNGVAEVIECGAGRDVVQADRRDRFRRCEIITR